MNTDLLEVRVERRTDEAEGICSYELVSADGAPLPPVCTGEPDPVMETAAVAGVPTLAPALGLESPTLKLFVPVKGVEFATGTEKLLAAVSPLAQVNVPVTAV